jgi:Phage tail protein
MPLADDYFSLVEAGWACGVTDANGVQWRLTEVDGWQSSGGTRNTRVNRPGRSGQLRGPVYKGERIVTLTGIAIAPDSVTLSNAGDQFGALLADGATLATLIGTDDSGVPKQALVELNAEAKFAKETDTVADWSIQLAAPDPHRYAVTPSTASCGLQSGSGALVFPLTFPLDFGSGFGGGVLTALSAGLQKASPVWTITGPVTNPSILATNTGEYLTFSGLFVASGQTLTVDADARTVLLQGTASRRGSLVTGSTFFSIRPGANRIAFQASDYDPTVTLTASWRDAF